MKSFPVYDWMITSLRLSGNELLLFAYLYTGYESKTLLSVKCIETRFKYLMSRATVYRCISSLVKKGYIQKDSLKPSYGYSNWICRELNDCEVSLEEAIRIAKTPWVKK